MIARLLRLRPFGLREVAPPVIERRLRVCNMGSIVWPQGPRETAWSADLYDPEAIAFREHHAGLPCFDHCPTSHYDWDLHRRHLIVEERVQECAA